MSIFVIAGGAGFLGAAVAARLGGAGHEVRVLDDLSGPASARRAAALDDLPSVAVWREDVRDPEACRRLCAGAEFVLHFAAPPQNAGAGRCADVVVGGALTLLDAARAAGTVRRFVCASSGGVYGESAVLTRHEASLPDPAAPLTCALLSAEHFCRAAFRRDGLQTVCLRYFDVYGPGMDIDAADGSPMAALVRAAATGEPAAADLGGGAGGDWLYIEDAVEACLRATAALRGVGGKVFNIGSGQTLSLGSVRENLEKLTGRPLTVYAPTGSSGGLCPGRADTAAAAGLLQFTASVAPVEGLALTLQWAKHNLVRMKELCLA